MITDDWIRIPLLLAWIMWLLGNNSHHFQRRGLSIRTKTPMLLDQLPSPFRRRLSVSNLPRPQQKIRIQRFNDCGESAFCVKSEVTIPAWEIMKPHNIQKTGCCALLVDLGRCSKTFTLGFQWKVEAPSNLPDYRVVGWYVCFLVDFFPLEKPAGLFMSK